MYVLRWCTRKRKIAVKCTLPAVYLVTIDEVQEVLQFLTYKSRVWVVCTFSLSKMMSSFSLCLSKSGELQQKCRPKKNRCCFPKSKFPIKKLLGISNWFRHTKIVQKKVFVILLFFVSSQSKSRSQRLRNEKFLLNYFCSDIPEPQNFIRIVMTTKVKKPIEI